MSLGPFLDVENVLVHGCSWGGREQVFESSHLALQQLEFVTQVISFRRIYLLVRPEN